MGQGDGRLDHDQVGTIVAHRLDEALVDLDLGRRHLLEIVERRQAGAIIVDRDPYAKVAQPGEQVDPVTAARNRRGFGQLQGQSVGIETVATEHCRDPLGQATVIEHPRRQIDRDSEVETLTR